MKMNTNAVAVAENQELNLIDSERVGELIEKMEEMFRRDIKTMAGDELPERIESPAEQRILEEILQDRKTFISAVQETYLPCKEAANKVLDILLALKGEDSPCGRLKSQTEN